MDLHANGGEKECFDLEVMLNIPGVPTAAPPAPAQSGGMSSYPCSRTPTEALGGPGAHSAARKDATYPAVLNVPPFTFNSCTHPAATWNGAADTDMLNEPSFTFNSSTHPAATWNGAAYTEWLAARLSSSGGRTPHHQGVHDGAPCPDADGLITAQLRSGAAPTAAPWNWNAVSCPGVLTAHLAPEESLAAWNDVVAHPGRPARPGVAMALGFGYVTGEGAADLGSERLRPTATAVAATVQSGGGGGGCYHRHHSGDMAVPFSAQVVVVDEPEDSDSLVKDPAVAQQDEDEVVAGAVAERPVSGGAGLVGVGGQMGAAAITLAVAGLTAGGEVNPSTAVPLLLMLIAGVTMVTVRVARG